MNILENKTDVSKWLPTSAKEGKQLGWEEIDVILLQAMLILIILRLAPPLLAGCSKLKVCGWRLFRNPTGLMIYAILKNSENRVFSLQLLQETWTRW